MKRKSCNEAVKQETPSPGKENATSKKTDTPKKTSAKKTATKTPAKNTPVKKKSPKTAEKSKATAKAKKASPPATSPFKVKAESQSLTKVKEEKDDEEMDTNTSAKDVKQEKPKAHPFFSKQKDIKLQTTEDTSGASYNPGKVNYHPIKDCFWEYGTKYVFDRMHLRII